MPGTEMVRHIVYCVLLSELGRQQTYEDFARFWAPTYKSNHKPLRLLHLLNSASPSHVCGGQGVDGSTEIPAWTPCWWAAHWTLASVHLVTHEDFNAFYAQSLIVITIYTDCWAQRKIVWITNFKLGGWGCGWKPSRLKVLKALKENVLWLWTVMATRTSCGLLTCRRKCLNHKIH